MVGQTLLASLVKGDDGVTFDIGWNTSQATARRPILRRGSSAAPDESAANRPNAWAASMEVGSFNSVSACKGELEISRFATQTRPSGASKTFSIANGCVRFMNVYKPRR